MLLRNIFIATTCVLQVALLAASGAADPSELHRKNQELVAKDYEVKDRQLVAARIGQRTSKVECSGLSRLTGCPEPKEVEIVGFLKSGEQLTIESILKFGLVSVWPTIVDRSGHTVGYFRSNLELDGNPPSHQVAFVIYFVGQKGLIRREGEAKCKKSPNDGYPSVRVSNARFDVDLRELEFTLHSSCYHIDLFGGGPTHTLNMLHGDFRYDAVLKDHRGVDLAQRVTVSFDGGGDTFTFGVAKGDAEKRRAFRKCIEDAKAGSEFRICRDGTRSRAFWRFGPDLISLGSCENGPDVVGKAYFVSACPSSIVDATKKWVDFMVASQDSPKGIEVSIECTCERLWVDRLNFNPERRVLSFNLDTDAKSINFAGGVFQVPTMASRPQDGKVSMEIPLFSIQFNEHWQIVEMTAATRDTSTATEPK